MVDLTGQLSNPQPQLRHVLHQDIPALGDPPNDEVRPSKPTERPRFHTQRRLKQSEITALVEGYQSGRSVTEMAAAGGVHRTTVTAHLHERGVVMRGVGQIDLADAVRLYEQGWSSRQLGEKFGVSANTVLRSLRRTGATIRPPRGG
jgi:lambda repressor-like predicted transcriptional regulator